MESFTKFDSYSLDQSQLYDNTTAPYTYSETPDTSDWWICCQCDGGREVNPDKDGESCPDCHHQKCEFCGTTKHPTTPIKEQSGFNFEAPTHGHSHFQEAVADYHEHARLGHSHHVQVPPVGDLSGPGYEYGRRPSMDGWWECCQCSQEVNSAWYGKDCNGCGHGYSEYCCTNLGSTSI